MYDTEANRHVAKNVLTNEKRMILHENQKDQARMSNAMAPPNDMLQEGGTMGRRAAKNFWGGAGSSPYTTVMNDNIQGGGLSAGVKKYRKKQGVDADSLLAPHSDLLPASNVSKGTVDRRLGKGHDKEQQYVNEGGRGDFTCSCKDKKKTTSNPRARKLIPVNDMSASTFGGSMAIKNARSIRIKKIMAEKGMSMIEASSYIKKNNLY